MRNKAKDYLERVKSGEVLELGGAFAGNKVYQAEGSLFLHWRESSPIAYPLTEVGMKSVLIDARESVEYNRDDEEFYSDMSAPVGYKKGQFTALKAGKPFLSFVGKLFIPTDNDKSIRRFELIEEVVEKKVEEKQIIDYVRNVVITITTKEMFQNYMECVKDNILADFDFRGIEGNWQDHAYRIRNILTGDVCQIRSMFLFGYTPLLLGEKMGMLDPYPTPEKEPDNIEIRVVGKNNKIILVLINDEIKW